MIIQGFSKGLCDMVFATLVWMQAVVLFVCQPSYTEWS